MAKIQDTFFEKTLEDILFKTEQKNIRDRGLYTLNYDGIFRQPILGNYGRPDLVTWKYHAGDNFRYLNICVYELKNVKITIDTFLQGIRYLKGVSIHPIVDRMFHNTTINYQLVLIGKELDLSNGLSYLADFMQTLHIFTFDYNYDGIHFTREDGYMLTDPGNIETSYGEYRTPNLRSIVKREYGNEVF